MAMTKLFDLIEEFVDAKIELGKINGSYEYTRVVNASDDLNNELKKLEDKING